MWTLFSAISLVIVDLLASAYVAATRAPECVQALWQQVVTTLDHAGPVSP